jgi:hypothetical protein
VGVAHAPETARRPEELVGCPKREERVMKPNIGKTERVVRIMVGLGVLSLAFVGPRASWAYLGILPLLSGLIGWCPPYALLGISTVRASK